jgi:hypothetical protein
MSRMKWTLQLDELGPTEAKYRQQRTPVDRSATRWTMPRVDWEEIGRPTQITIELGQDTDMLERNRVALQEAIAAEPIKASWIRATQSPGTCA